MTELGVFETQPDRQQSIAASARLALSHTVEHAKEVFMTGYRRFLPGVAVVASVGGGLSAEAYEPQLAEAAGSAVHSTQYLKKNCPITVPVNVFAPGGTHDAKRGVTVHGQKIEGATSSNVQYTWTLSNKDDFCGIVGVWSGAKEVSLRPTSQTAHSGEYKDTSINNLNGSHLSEFIVYARPK